MAKKLNKRRRRIIKEEPVSRNCIFCKTNKNPDYKDFESLSKYVSDRARILGKDRTGICSKHQRRLSTAIKRARHLALLPYVPSLK